MAFDKSGLTRIGGDKKSGAPTVWTYRTNDNIATSVDAAGYFDNGSTTNTGMREHMSVGDVIIVHGTADTTPTFALLFVNANSSGIIDTTNTMLGTTIDSD
jgi:hypothetical protein